MKATASLAARLPLGLVVPFAPLAGSTALAGAVAGAMMGAMAGVVAGVMMPAPAFAQEVVQPLPPQSVSDLSNALQRLARDSQNVAALIDAGNASIQLGDIDAAIGFFGRAQELSPRNGQIKLGLASAYIRKQRPLDALRLFDEAQTLGAPISAMAGDRGLAYDLVGDTASARQQYTAALAAREDATVRQRLALNHAISGDRRAFDAVLAPLLAQNATMAYRVQAFGLAILGDDAAAIDVAGRAMPQDQSARIAPYLRYMSQLTRAQQAAAANFGVFPQAAQIGQDRPRIAQYTPASDDRLTPVGQPLGNAAQRAPAATARSRPRAEPRNYRTPRSERRAARTATEASTDLRKQSRSRPATQVAVPTVQTANPAEVAAVLPDNSPGVRCARNAACRSAQYRGTGAGRQCRQFFHPPAFQLPKSQFPAFRFPAFQPGAGRRRGPGAFCRHGRSRYRHGPSPRLCSCTGNVCRVRHARYRCAADGSGSARLRCISICGFYAGAASNRSAPSGGRGHYRDPPAARNRCQGTPQGRSRAGTTCQSAPVLGAGGHGPRPGGA